MRVPLMLVVVAALAHAQAPAVPKPEPARSARLTIAVIDATTRVPVKGAEVEINVANVNSTAELVNSSQLPITDEHGEIEFALVPGEHGIAWIKAEGYTFDWLPNSSAIVLKNGERRRIEVALTRGGNVSGTVTDSDGRPVAGAYVELLELDFLPTKRLAQAGEATTDNQGRYRIAGVRAGLFYVRVSSLDSPLAIVTNYFPNGDDIRQATRLRLDAGKELDRIDLRVRRTEKLHLRGRVDGITGSGKFLDIMNCSSGLHEGTPMRTDARIAEDGTFDATVTPGTYCVEYRETDGDVIRSLVRIHVRVTDHDVDDLRLTPAAPKELTGVVKLEERSGLRMPLLISLRPAGQLLPFRSGMVRTDGTFSIPGVFPIDYQFNAMTLGGYVKSIKLGTLDLTNANLNGSIAPGPLTIEVAAARGRMKGTVTLGSAKPHRITVVLAPAGAQSERSDLARATQANAQAEFAFAAVPPGVYKVLAFDEGNSANVLNAEVLSFFQGPTVRIAEGEEPNIELRLITHTEIVEAQGRLK